MTDAYDLSRGGILQECAYLDVPNELCPPSIAEALQAQTHGARLTKAFLCFLAITGKRIGATAIADFAALVPAFVGALYSPKFWAASTSRRYQLASDTVRCVRALAPKHPSSAIVIRFVSATSEVAENRREFECMPLDDVQVELWRGWPIRNATGRVAWLPLRPIYLSLGAGWTRSLYAAISAWFRASRRTKIPGITGFVNFLALDMANSSARLLDRLEVGAFWRRFWGYYSSNRPASNKVLVADWMNFWVDFGEKILPMSGLFSTPAGGFPGPRAVPESAHRGAQDASEPLELLLIDVPRTASDTEALRWLLERIPSTLNIIETWATTQAAILYEAYRNRRRLARVGHARPAVEKSPGLNNGSRWNRSRENPAHLSNAAATFAQFGFLTENEERLGLLYPRPLRRTARELGMPVAGSLTAHCALLVLEHPVITPSFLENFVLYDKNGKLTGLVRTSKGTTYMVGYKHRRGPRLSEQRVLLTRRTLRVVWQLILITRSAREFLKAEADDSWRYLLLTTGKGFGRPLPVRKLSTYTSLESHLTELAQQLEAHAGLEQSEAGALAARFSLRTLRATAGVQVFMKTHSEREMADALGHEQFSPALMANYLPPAILAFFRKRWVAAFQVNVLAIVMAGTGYELAATGFETLKDLELFMANNALPMLPRILQSSPEPSGGPQNDGRLYFNANELTLAFLYVAVEKTAPPRPQYDPELLYWGEFGRALLPVIESRAGLDPELDACVDAAQSGEARARVEAVFHG